MPSCFRYPERPNASPSYPPPIRRIPENMDLGRGVALNEALCENLFILLVSVLNSISVFVVGKPGSSKSLAVNILVRSLKGRESSSPFLRSFPAVEVFSHQCSPQSTSQGILQVCTSAPSYVYGNQASLTGHGNLTTTTELHSCVHPPPLFFWIFYRSC